MVEKSEVNERACLVIKSMKSTEKKKRQTVVSSYTFVLLPGAPMIVAGVSAGLRLSVWGCNFSGSAAYLRDLARVAKLVLNE